MRWYEYAYATLKSAVHGSGRLESTASVLGTFALQSSAWKSRLGNPADRMSELRHHKCMVFHDSPATAVSLL
jgi:hypothetical protein